MILSLYKSSQTSFVRALQEAGHAFVVSDSIVGRPEYDALALRVDSSADPEKLASVLFDWNRGNAGRLVMLVMEDGAVCHVGTRSSREIQALLAKVARISILGESLK